MKRKCPLGWPDKTWCVDCRFAKEGLCDWPNSYPPPSGDSERANVRKEVSNG